MAPSACQHCHWWDRLIGQAAPRGYCHGGPPTADQEDGHAIWPVTNQSDHCGAFRIAEALAGGRDKTLLLAMTGEKFSLSNDAIWVREMQIALSVDTSGQVAA